MDLILKILDFYTWIIQNNGPHFENCGLLHVNFPKWWTPFCKLWTFTHEFFRIMDLIFKIGDFYAWICQNNGPHFENWGLLHVNFPKWWTSFCKLRTFTHEFFKIMDLILKIVDFYSWIFQKDWCRFENCGLLRLTFSK
jgi:hypothetical protein